MNLTELLGTAASVVVALSLMMRNIRWLRTVNTFGSLAFAIYGFLIQAWPVFGLNAFIVVVNLYYLVQLAATKDRFSLLEVPAADAEPASGSLLARFLATHGPDLAKFQPDFPRKLPEGARVFFVLREVLPISLFVAVPEGRGRQRVLIDYAVPAWRDYQNARFLFNEGLKDCWPAGTVLAAQAPVKAHAAYLKRLGFVPGAAAGTWEKTL